MPVCPSQCVTDNGRVSRCCLDTGKRVFSTAAAPVPASTTRGMPALCQRRSVPAGTHTALPWPSMPFKRLLAHFSRLNNDEHPFAQPPTSEGYCRERKVDLQKKVYHHCTRFKNKLQPEGFSSRLHKVQGLHQCRSRAVKGNSWCQ